MSPRAQLVTVVCTAAVVAVLAWVTSLNRPVPPPAYEVVPVLFAGAATAIGGVLVGRWRPGNRIAWMLVAIGLLMAVSLLAYANHAIPFTVGGVIAGTYYAVVIHLLLALPEGRLATRADRVLVGLAYADAAASSVTPNLFFRCTNPFGLGCPGNLLLVRDDPVLVERLDTLWGAAGAVLVVAVGIRLALRWRHAGLGLRRVLSAPYLGGAPVLSVAAADALQVLDRYGAVLTLLQPLVLCLLPAGVLLGVLRSRARSGDVGSLVRAVDPGGAVARLQLEPLLARALGDPTARLLTPEAATQGHAPSRARAAVTAHGRTLAVLDHDGVADTEPEVMEAVLATASLALENERLESLARAQLDEVQGSRRRLVTAHLEERRRLERDLHDGAQQRLVTARLMLAMALERHGDPALVAQAAGLLDEATSELRDLARGVHPSVVTEHGLDGAVEALAERASLPVEVHGTVARLPELCEITAYYVVAEALANVAKHADASLAEVDLTVDGGTLRLAVTDDGVGGAVARRGSGLSGLQDRVEAAGGTLRLRSDPAAGTTLAVELPLDSIVGLGSDHAPGHAR